MADVLHPDGESAEEQAAPRLAEHIEHADPLHANVVLVDWMLGNACNYACSYCPSALHDGSVRWQRLDAAIGFLDRLNEHFSVGLGRTVWLQFTGGEPTMYPGFFELMERAGALGQRRSLISNGSRTMRFWERAVEAIDNAILTYHDEFVDHDHFLAVAGLIASVRPLHVNVTAHPARFEAILARVEALKETVPTASITLKPLRVDFMGELYPYTEAQMEKLSQRVSSYGNAPETFPRGVMRARYRDGSSETLRANEFILRGVNLWRGYRCHAGLESLRVKADGSVLRAVCGVGGTIGHIEGELAFPMLSVVCTRPRCACVSDILITKRRPGAGRRSG